MPRDHLGDRMLDLEPGVDLHEIVVFVAVQQKFDGAGIGVVGRLGRLDRGLADLLRQFRRQVEGRGDLHQLLVAALDGAVPGTEMDGLAVLVGDDLHLDMLGVEHHLFQVDRVVVEGGHGLLAGDLVLFLQILVTVDAADAPAAAAGGGLEHQRIAVFFGKGRGLPQPLVAGGQVLGARDHGDAGLGHDLPGRNLVAQLFDDVGIGADEDQAGVLAGLGQQGILGEKAVARMDGDWRRNAWPP